MRPNRQIGSAEAAEEPDADGKFNSESGSACLGAGNERLRHGGSRMGRG